MVRPCTLAMDVAMKSQTESLRSGTIQECLPLSRQCLRTIMTTPWCIRLPSYVASNQACLRLKVRSSCRRAAAATYVSSKKAGTALEEHNDRSKKGAGPFGTTDMTEAQTRHVDHQTLGSASACSADYKRGHRGAPLAETMLLFLCLFAGLLCGDEMELEVQRLRLASLGEFPANLSSTKFRL
ncbi:hypothetical protein VPH35_104593 [Triticum aestivum]